MSAENQDVKPERGTATDPKMDAAKPKRTRRPASDRVRAETEKKLKLGLTELQPYSAMFLGPLSLSDDEVDDLARVGGKLAARHESIAKAIETTDEASVYLDAGLVVGKMVLRRHALVQYGLDINDPMQLLEYIQRVRNDRNGTGAQSAEYETNAAEDFTYTPI